VKKPNAAFWIGLVIYATSFFLPSVGDMRGYTLAWFALAVPFDRLAWSHGPISVLVPLAFLSGLVNPVFVAAVVACFLGGNRAFQVLRIVALSLFPCGWIFCLMKTTRAGYFLWFLGMLLVLFSSWWDRAENPPLLFKPASAG
jgi:hypothetical protein